MNAVHHAREGLVLFSCSEGPAAPGEEPVRGDAVLEDEVGKPLDAEDAPGVVGGLLGEVAPVHAEVPADAPLGDAPREAEVVVGLEPAVGNGCFGHFSY